MKSATGNYWGGQEANPRVQIVEELVLCVV